MIETFASLITRAGHELPPVPPVSRAMVRTFHGARRAMSLSGFEAGKTDAPYDAAGAGHRSSKWNPGADAISALLASSGDTLRRKVRQLVRNNAWADNALESYVANAIGTGIVPTSLHPDPAIKSRIEEAWNRWVDESDADGVGDFYGQQQLAARIMLEGGEAFARMRPRRPEDGLSVPLQVQLLESEQCPITYNLTTPNGNKVRSGIEFDGIGRRVAYHFYKDNPYSGATSLVDDPTTITIVPSVLVNPMAGALHLFTPIRAGQLRGQPRFTPVITKLYELDQFDDATLSKQKNLAFFMLLIKRVAAEATGIMGEAAGEIGEDDDAADASVTMEPNTLQYLEDGEEAQEIGGKGPGAEYETFMRVQLHAIAAGLGITYEQLTGDLKGVTYSSIRQGVLEFRRRCEQWQHNVMVFQFCRPIWRAWMDAAVLSGALVLPGYDEDPWPYLQAEWTPPAWPWVDPETDVNAAIKSVRAGFVDRGAVCKSQGTSREEVDRKQKEDNASADAAKVKYDSDGRNPASGAATNTPTKGQQEQRQAPAQDQGAQPDGENQ